MGSRGSIDDYWVSYDSTDNDPYITNGWAQHSWGTAIGDYMKTSQSASPYNNTDGSTKFFNYTSNSAKLTCSTMVGGGIANEDGTYGRKLFYEARGYTVSDCYNQRTDNSISGGFSLANFQSEINAGNPVLLNLAGHSIVGYGYEGSTIYIRDTWSSDPGFNPTMIWGTSYQGMPLLSVSVVHPVVPHPTKLVFLPVALKPQSANLTPTDIWLTNNVFMENQPINSLVGTLSTVDPNPGDTFSYSLVKGSGDSGNISFNILGSQLRSSAVFDFEAQNSYSIRIRTTDENGLFFEKVFTITIVQSSGSQLFPNGDFEQGRVVWNEYSSHGYALIMTTAGGLLVSPYDGNWAVWLGGDADETSYIQQQIQVPANLPYMSYWYWIASADVCGYDVAGVLVNGTAIDAYWLCNMNDTNEWVRRVIDLRSYAGQTVSIQIMATLDGSSNSNLFIDHVSFIANTNAANSPAVYQINNDLKIMKSEPELK
jgi:hypothetical protein